MTTSALNTHGQQCRFSKRAENALRTPWLSVENILRDKYRDILKTVVHSDTTVLFILKKTDTAEPCPYCNAFTDLVMSVRRTTNGRPYETVSSVILHSAFCIYFNFLSVLSVLSFIRTIIAHTHIRTNGVILNVVAEATKPKIICTAKPIVYAPPI